MLDILIGLAAALAVAIVGLLAYASTRPDSFHVARSVTIAAQPGQLFPLIDDLAVFNTWNPFNKDSGIKGSCSGPKNGPGAAYDFESARSGTGRIFIVESRSPSHVVMRLQMVKPMACDNRIDFTIEPVAGGSRVTWAMQGKSPLVARAIQVFCNMDRICGGQFEKGLAELKSKVEAAPGLAV